MALDLEHMRALGIQAGTLAQWLKDNRERVLLEEEKGICSPDDWGMYTMATGFLRLYKEAVDHGIIRLPTVDAPPALQ